MRAGRGFQVVLTYLLLLLYYGFLLIPMASIVLEYVKTQSAIGSSRLLPALSNLTLGSYREVLQATPFLPTSAIPQS